MRRIDCVCVAFLLLLLGGMVLASCKKTSEEPIPAGTTPTVEETEQVTRITDATAPATHVWKQPTTAIKIEATPTPTVSTSADAELIERGKGLYEKKECAKCHGDSAQGMEGKGAKLAGTALTEDEFKDILRTGGKGKLGDEHIFGTSVISESGIKAMYAFLRSLESGEK